MDQQPPVDLLEVFCYSEALFCLTETLWIPPFNPNLVDILNKTHSIIVS